MVKMKQKILAFLVIAGVVYLWHFHPLWLIIPFAVITLVLVAVLVLLFIWVLRDVDKHEKEIRSYLDECDEKLKKGEMTKEENFQIHFYWECENWGIC